MKIRFKQGITIVTGNYPGMEGVPNQGSTVSFHFGQIVDSVADFSGVIPTEPIAPTMPIEPKKPTMPYEQAQMDKYNTDLAQYNVDLKKYNTDYNKYNKDCSKYREDWKLIKNSLPNWVTHSKAQELVKCGMAEEINFSKLTNANSVGVAPILSVSTK